jgi:FtsZ-binding cell division protein ZapB
MIDFTVGEQPCQDYSPGLGIHGFANLHECFGPFDGRFPRVCYGRVSNCKNCHTDHHSGGYETCGKTPIPHVETEAEATEYVHQLEGWLAEVRERSANLLEERNELRKAMRTLGNDYNALSAEHAKWQEEARSYCQNASYHRQKREQAEAELAALKAVAEAMEEFIDSCTYHMRDGDTVVYEGARP